jgi:hypothetical protein
MPSAPVAVIPLAFAMSRESAPVAVMPSAPVAVIPSAPVAVMPLGKLIWIASAW